ncbi:MAG: effector-associated domain EAD1-containing protein [Saprospiraceae bacterium]|nr:effector-associated domain EAD1-containing protein [Saprospiraceae bacterium]
MNQYRNLIERLAELFPNADAALMIVQFSGLSPTLFTFSGPPKNMWFHIIAEALKHKNGVQQLIESALEDYQGDDILTAALRIASPSPQQPTTESTPIPSNPIDILISFAAFDNEPLIKGEPGWISGFQESLETRLKQLVGRKVSIWLNNSNDPNSGISPSNINQFPEISLMLSIVSPKYLDSKKYEKEIEAFEISCKKNGLGTIVNNQSRIFKIVKTFVDEDRQTKLFRSLTGYDFFKKIGEDRYKEYRRVYSDLDLDYLDKLDDLCYDIRHALENLEKAKTEEKENVVIDNENEVEENGDGINIYLASTSSDLNQFREIIRKELQDHKHNVYPQNHLPLIMPEVENSIQDFLGQCDMSIHLFGNKYGIIPEDCDKSLPVLQNELASAHSSSKDFSRLIWTLPGVDPRDLKQKQFLEYLENNLDGQRGADILKNNIEEFKYFIHDKIEEIIAAKAKPDPIETGMGEDKDVPPLVYLICDQKDFDRTTEIFDCLFDNYQLDVVTPVYEGDENEIRSIHLDYLKSCDATLIYYGSASDLWLRPKVQDLRKIAGYGRSTPLKHKAIYVAGPTNKQKERLRFHDTLLIDGLNGFDPEQLTQFVNKIKKSA